MTVRFGVSLDEDLLERFDSLIDQMGYENRSEAVRDLIREKLVEEEWQAPNEEIFGAAFIVYDHHTMSALNRLNDLQHDHVENVISTMHVHIDEHNCLEIVLLKGPGEKVRRVGQKMCSLKGVKYGKLNLGTTGKRIR